MTGNQWSSWSIGVIWSCLRERVTKSVYRPKYVWKYTYSKSRICLLINIWNAWSIIVFHMSLHIDYFFWDTLSILRMMVTYRSPGCEVNRDQNILLAIVARPIIRICHELKTYCVFKIDKRVAVNRARSCLAHVHSARTFVQLLIWLQPVCRHVMKN